MHDPEIVEALKTHRRIPGWLMVGIVLAPLIFTWFLLGKGYSTSVRLAAFGYMLLVPLLVVLSNWF
ncbi:MAG: hypothetical protein JWR84_3058 [Caulobacter sp.]|nr:hypothetical protein [Caulobacter sp.]